MEMEEFLLTDSEALYSIMKRQENQLIIKRRWLMGLPLSDHEEKYLNRVNERIFPESMVRSDDVHYEIVRAFVEKGFWRSSLHSGHSGELDNNHDIDLPNLRTFLSMLDDMTNHGLQIVVEILTSGSIKFEKTRWKMKKIIRKSLPGMYKRLKSNCDGDLAKQLHQLLRNPQYFQRNCSSPEVSTSQPYHAAIKVLEGLEEMSHQSLSAMHRKLRGIQGYVPQLQPKKSGWGRSLLIDQVRKSCLALMSKLDEEDELQEPLAKAMAVGGLSSKLLQGCSFVTEFRQFSPEIEALQTEIAKAIWLLNENVAFAELKNLQLLLDQDAKLSNRSLRTSIKNLLMEYLFECSDMNTIPDYFIKVLATINGRSTITPPFRFFLKEEREEEVEHVLVVSAQMKQILWDLLPDYEFDKNFKDAYMEYLEESDDDCSEENDTDDQLGVFTQTNFFPLYYTCEETVGESNPVPSISHASTPNRILRSDSTQRAEHEDVTRMTSMYSDASASPSTFDFGLRNMLEDGFQTGDFEGLNGCCKGDRRLSQYSPDASCNGIPFYLQETGSEKPSDIVSTNFSHELNFDNNKTNMSENKYIAIQEACDKTSMVAYSLVGRLLDKIAHIDAIPLDSSDVSYLRGGNSVPESHKGVQEEHMSNEEEVHGTIVQVLEELLPSFPQSGKTMLKEFMGIK